MSNVTISLPGPPKGKGRPRFVRKTAYTPADTRNYEAMLRHAAMEQMRKQKLQPFHGPLDIVVFAYFPIPTSWSAKKQSDAAMGHTRPTVKPDIDNIVKMADALNGIVWDDDKQIVSCVAKKYYSRSPQLSITVYEQRRKG